MADTDRSPPGSGTGDLPTQDAHRAAPDTGVLHEDDLAFLQGITRSLIRDDPAIVEMRQLEGLSEDEVIEQADTYLTSENPEVLPPLRMLRDAQSRRNEALSTPSSVVISVAGACVIVGILGITFLVAVEIIKLTGYLRDWPIWELAVFSPALLVIGGIVVVIADGDVPETSQATATAERLKRNLDAAVRSLILIPAIERMTSIRLLRPDGDMVTITDAPSLGSRIESNRRIQTESYRDVFSSLRREGGATVGLAGSRGAGKSELLAAFCNDPDRRPSVEAGGVIGIIIPAPIAYEAQPFLRVLIRRLAEAVPEARQQADHSRPSLNVRDLIPPVLACALVVAGLDLYQLHVRLSASHRRAAGVLLVGLAVVILGWWGSRPQTRRVSRSFFYSRSTAVGRIVTAEGTADSEKVGARINTATRRRLSIQAASVARRVSYVEKRSMTSETALSWNSLGLKRASGTDLDQIPFTEPDLVMELSKLVESLHNGGYEIRIGIDELDKLTAGDEAERFLTGIKVLFSIRYCSFLLTISENAAAQFAHRGLPIRDVFDSSLDTVVTVKPLTFSESRRLLRTRLSAESARISDSQVLLCHYLSGGLPRDLLRACRQLGEFNVKLGGNATLKNVMDKLLKSEVDAMVDAAIFALRSRDEGERGAEFLRELQNLALYFDGRTLFPILDEFLANDSDFADLCGTFGPEAAHAAASHTAAVRTNQTQAARENRPGTPNEPDWIRAARRRLYSFAYFIETVRQMLERAHEQTLTAGQMDQDTRLELVADARRRIELDAAAGWRRTTQARVRYSLIPPRPGPQPVPEESPSPSPHSWPGP